MRDWWACDGCGERVTRDGNVLVKELAAQLAIMTERASEWEKRALLVEDELIKCRLRLKP